MNKQCPLLYDTDSLNKHKSSIPINDKKKKIETVLSSELHQSMFPYKFSLLYPPNKITPAILKQHEQKINNREDFNVQIKNVTFYCNPLRTSEALPCNCE